MLQGNIDRTGFGGRYSFPLQVSLSVSFVVSPYSKVAASAVRTSEAA